ncbi:MAG: hypothetical protein GXY61_10235 [Lentisphaerae bacterium]|nr:hypothetical protein [Lentisphaerota bacterium]
MKTKTASLLVLLLTVSAPSACPAQAEQTNAVFTVESKPVFHRSSVGSVVDNKGNERDYQMVWLVFNRGQERIQVLWEKTTKHAPVFLEPDKTYIFELKTMNVGTRDVFYVHKVREGDKVIVQNWIP